MADTSILSRPGFAVYLCVPILMLLFSFVYSAPNITCSSNPTYAYCYNDPTINSVPQDFNATITFLLIEMAAISDLSDADFVNYTLLQEIIIINSGLSIIDPHTFDNLAQLAYVDLSYNSGMAGVVDVSWIYGLKMSNVEIILQGNNIESMTISVPHPTTTSPITTTTPPTTTPTTTTMSTTTSSPATITSLTSMTTSPSTATTTSAATTTTTTSTLPTTTLPTLPSLVQTLDLTGQPLHCNCELIWLRNWTVEILLSGGTVIANCASPAALVGPISNITDISLMTCQPPKIIGMMPAGTVTFCTGDTVNITCTATGDPAPAVQITFDTGYSTPTNPTSIGQTSTVGFMSIPSLSTSNTGLYQCSASNYNTTTTFVWMFLVVDPSCPTTTSLTTTTSPTTITTTSPPTTTMTTSQLTTITSPQTTTSLMTTAISPLTIATTITSPASTTTTASPTTTFTTTTLPTVKTPSPVTIPPPTTTSPTTTTMSSSSDYSSALFWGLTLVLPVCVAVTAAASAIMVYFKTRQKNKVLPMALNF